MEIINQILISILNDFVNFFKKIIWRQLIILLLEVIIITLALFKISVVTIDNVRINKALVETSKNLTIALNQLYSYNLENNSNKIYLVNVEDRLRKSADALTQFLGIEIPGCGYDLNSRPMNSEDAPLRLVSESHGPVGKLLDLDTSATYLDGTPCKPKIIKIGLLDQLKMEAIETNRFEIVIALFSVIVFVLKFPEYKIIKNDLAFSKKSFRR